MYPTWAQATAQTPLHWLHRRQTKPLSLQSECSGMVAHACASNSNRPTVITCPCVQQNAQRQRSGVGSIPVHEEPSAWYHTAPFTIAIAHRRKFASNPTHSLQVPPTALGT